MQQTLLQKKKMKTVWFVLVCSTTQSSLILWNYIHDSLLLSFHVAGTPHFRTSICMNAKKCVSHSCSTEIGNLTQCAIKKTNVKCHFNEWYQK